MENEKKRKLTLMQRIRKTYMRLKNFRSKIVNDDFRQFQTLEYGKVNPEDLKDIERLEYLKNLDLAKNGYINEDVEKLIKYYQTREELLTIDLEVLPVGHIVIKDEEQLLSMAHLGFSEKLDDFKFAINSHDNILKWKPMDISKLITHFQKLHPSNGESLQFYHSFFLKDLQIKFSHKWETISEKYNTTIKQAFYSNKYFESGIKKLDLDILKSPLENIGQTFLFPEPYRGHQILTLTEGNKDYLVFQSFLETLPTYNTFYFSHDDLKTIHDDAHIDTLAKLKKSLILGTKDGQLLVGKTSDKTDEKIKWHSFKDALKNPNFSAEQKYYLSKKIIKEKNFFLEKGAITLKNGLILGFLKKHYKTNRWHFAQSYIGDKKDLNFRPIDKRFQAYIDQTFPDSKNKHLVLNAINKEIADDKKNRPKNEIKF